jgi:16S rRNA C967 or C1407 C5-methylase (RsmB/RsmF family)
VTLLGNIERQGFDNVIVTNTDAKTLAGWFDSVFDLVLCDAPCSGEGMFRKNPDAVAEWSEENVALCAARQKEILHSAAKTVKRGGYLVYSTCTFSKEENEDVVSIFSRKTKIFRSATRPKK